MTLSAKYKSHFLAVLNPKPCILSKPDTLNPKMSIRRVQCAFPSGIFYVTYVYTHFIFIFIFQQINDICIYVFICTLSLSLARALSSAQRRCDSTGRCAYRPSVTS
jgi:hypothetical protein